MKFHTSFTAAAVLAALFLVNSSYAFYLPGVAPQDFAKVRIAFSFFLLILTIQLKSLWASLSYFFAGVMGWSSAGRPNQSQSKQN